MFFDDYSSFGIFFLKSRKKRSSLKKRKKGHSTTKNESNFECNEEVGVDVIGIGGGDL